MKQARYYQRNAAEALFNAIKEDPTCHPIAAIPTGAGKTMVMSEFIDLCVSDNYKTNVLVLSHVKEILEQNHATLSEHFDGVDIGLYSAGLESKTIKKVTVAGIQSVYRNAKSFRHFNVVIIDECHLVNTKDAGMYRSFLSKLNANYVGLTATPYRTGHGFVHIGDTALFNKLVFDMSNVDGFLELINNGFLCPLISKSTETEFDTEGLSTRMHDFVESEMSARFDNQELTNAAVEEVIRFGENYRKWLVFAIDIEHAEHIAKAFNERGVPTAFVHSQMQGDRSDIIADYKAGKYRCLVNVNILTTGFDAPDIDLIAMLRPTQSPILHVQTLGRGMRTSPGKQHCLVLDFAGNVLRLGPINDIRIRQKGDGTGGGGTGMRECPACKGHIPIASRECGFCGYVFPIKIEKTASTAEIIKQHTVVTPPVWADVSTVFYQLHHKPGKPDIMRVTYLCGTRNINEYVCYDHDGYAGFKAKNWVGFRLIDGDMPNNVRELLVLANTGKLREPKKIFVSFGSKYPTIENAEF